MPHRLMLVHPHPDDESISCGGIALLAVRDGHHVCIVTCTGGEEGENQAGIDLGGRPMDEVRRDEMVAALAVLGVEDHHWLGYRDSGMAGEPSNHSPGSFHDAPLDEAAGRLASIVREQRPDVVVSDGEDGTYGHPDHVKAHAVTARGLELAAAPSFEDGRAPWSVAKRYVFVTSRSRLWTLHRSMLAAGLASPWGDDEPAGPQDLPFGADDERVTTTVDVGDVLDRKLAAMAAHRSQIGPDSFFLNTPPELDDQAFSVEEFVLVDGDLGDTVGGRERDVFAGLAA